MREFPRYVEDMIIAIADRQTGPNVLPLNLDEIHTEIFADCPNPYVQMIIPELERLGLGKNEQTTNARVFRINGAGISRAAQIRQERRPRTFKDWLQGFSRSDWIAFGALAISAIALLK